MHLQSEQLPPFHMSFGQSSGDISACTYPPTLTVDGDTVTVGIPARLQQQGRGVRGDHVIPGMCPPAHGPRAAAPACMRQHAARSFPHSWWLTCRAARAEERQPPAAPRCGPRPAPSLCRVRGQSAGRQAPLAWAPAAVLASPETSPAPDAWAGDGARVEWSGWWGGRHRHRRVCKQASRTSGAFQIG